MKTELHIHTRYSHDSLLCLNLLAVMCKIKKIDCIAICDHNTISGGLKAKKTLSRYGIQVIVGEEIFTDSGEIIGLFLNRNIPAGLTANKTVSEIRSQNGLVYIPHPYDSKRHRTVLNLEVLKEIANQIDFIEIHNGRNISIEFSLKQTEVAKKYTNSKETIRVCGSDAHIFFEIGRDFLISDNYNPDCADDFKEKMKSAKIYSVPCCRFSHKITRLVRVIKLILEGNINELYRIVKGKCS